MVEMEMVEGGWRWGFGVFCTGGTVERGRIVEGERVLGWRIRRLEKLDEGSRAAW